MFLCQHAEELHYVFECSHSMDYYIRIIMSFYHSTYIYTSFSKQLENTIITFIIIKLLFNIYMIYNYDNYNQIYIIIQLIWSKYNVELHI